MPVTDTDPGRSTHAPRIGVLAMQGAFAEHVAALHECGADAFEVRTRAQLDQCDGVVLPGGESTAIRKALDRCELLEPLRTRIEAGLPTLGTCAGMIVLADTAPDGAPPCFALLDIQVERNGFGSQVHSFEGAVRWSDERVTEGVFIRAPRIVRTGPDVEVLATLGDGDAAGEPVAVRDGHLLAATFHPELTSDRTLHARLVELARTAAPTTGG
ncbi:MAG: glutamine amidotransferase [Thermoleophilia bacterium]|nr:glutamine amidotransferase [Thermoleophilia bacterium]